VEEMEKNNEIMNLIDSYEIRISMVEGLITAVYHSAVIFKESLDKFSGERETLKNSLQETLAKSCSLRKKDFNFLIEKILADSEREKKEIEEEQKQVGEGLEEYLKEQKRLATSLRENLTRVIQGEKDGESLEQIINEIKATYQNKGEKIFGLLRSFQLHLETFQKGQKEINHKLQQLVDRGESLKIKDLRAIEAAKSRQERESERELRREEVKHLLSHFKQERLDRDVMEGSEKFIGRR